MTNLAARLCTMAGAGQILISQRIFGMVEDLVEVEPASELHLKGFSSPLPAFNLVRLKESQPEGP